MQRVLYSGLVFTSLKSEFSLFNEAELDTSAWEERNDGLLAFTDDEDVVDSGGE